MSDESRSVSNLEEREKTEESGGLKIGISVFLQGLPLVILSATYSQIIGTLMNGIRMLFPKNVTPLSYIKYFLSN